MSSINTYIWCFKANSELDRGCKQQTALEKNLALPESTFGLLSSALEVLSSKEMKKKNNNKKVVLNSSMRKVIVVEQ